VEWWLDEEGYPDPKKQGKIRYYLVIDDRPVFADTREELMERYPEQCKIWNPIAEEYVIIEPKSIEFIAGTIFDNPILIAQNPKYLAELKSLPKIEKARLLDGNWYARPQGSNYFSRDWLHKEENAPLGCQEVRGWDKASTEPSEKNRYPDYTASIKMLKSEKGRYYIRGDFHPDNKETNSDNEQVFGRFRKRPGDRDKVMLTQAYADGSDCQIVLPEDPGAAGKVEYEHSAKLFSEDGFIVCRDPSPSNKSKLKKFEPFSSAAQNGLVSIIESSFPNKATLEAFYNELESFDGSASTSARKDD
jgi:phage terminase large subunit-like protein